MVSTRLEPGVLFEYYSQGADVVTVYIDVNVYDSLLKVLLYLIKYFSCSAWSSQYILVSMILDPGRPFKWYAQWTDIVVVHVDVNIDELERKVGGSCLGHSSATVLITTGDHPVELV